MTSDLAVELMRRWSEDQNILGREKGQDLLERIAIAYIEQNIEWKECKDFLRDKKVFRDWEPKIKLEARNHQNVASIGNAPSLTNTPVSQFWSDAGVHSEASAPPGFGFCNPADPQVGAVFKIIYKTRKDGTVSTSRLKAIGSPVVIRRRIMHDDGGISLELAWKTGKHWVDHIYNREHVFDSSKIVARTAGDGMPVSSANNHVLVEYLAAYEEHNLLLIPCCYSSSTLGWQGSHGNPTHHGFLFGHQQIGANGRQIEFRGAGPGDVTDGELYHSSGTFEEWKTSLGQFTALPAFKILIYAALAPPLLPILGAPNTIVEIVGDTSRGKSTAMEVAQSCWRASKTVFDTWDNTVVGFETKAQLHTDMPLFIDDTKTAIEHGKKQQLAKIIYQFVSGRGRGRGARDGGQRGTSYWRSLMITSGEVPSSDIAQSEGAAARVLSLWGTPLGQRVTAQAATLAQEIVDHKLNENYGHAGPRVVRWLFENKSKWPELKKIYTEIATRVRETFPSAAASRLAKVIALLDTASYVAAEAGCLPWKRSEMLDDPEILDLLRSALEHATKASDHATHAWRHVLSYAEARPSQWLPYGTDSEAESPPEEPKPLYKMTPPGHYPSSDPRSDHKETRTERPRREPVTGWLGWINDSHFFWFPSQLKRALKESQYPDEIESILRKWSDRSVIESTTGRLGVFKHCRGEGLGVWVVPLRRELDSEEQIHGHGQVVDPPSLDQEPDDFIPF